MELNVNCQLVNIDIVLVIDAVLEVICQGIDIHSTMQIMQKKTQRKQKQCLDITYIKQEDTFVKSRVHVKISMCHPVVHFYANIPYFNPSLLSSTELPTHSCLYTSFIRVK